MFTDLLLISHWTTSEHGHPRPCILLNPLQRIAFWTKNFPHKIKLWSTMTNQHSLKTINIYSAKCQDAEPYHNERLFKEEHSKLLMLCMWHCVCVLQHLGQKKLQIAKVLHNSAYYKILSCWVHTSKYYLSRKCKKNHKLKHAHLWKLFNWHSDLDSKF